MREHLTFVFKSHVLTLFKTWFVATIRVTPAFCHVLSPLPVRSKVMWSQMCMSAEQMSNHTTTTTTSNNDVTCYK